MFLFWPCALAVLADLSWALPEYFAVCDAGSTGTRLYVFQLDAATSEAKSIFVKKTKPGLSSYSADPTAAVAPLLKLLREGAEVVPANVRREMPLAIFGTAGVRMLDAPAQASIWESVVSGLRSAEVFPFAPDLLEARTATGTEEGRWAMYNANFLAGRVSHDLTSLGMSAPLALMDLGGSSTQIAIPVASAAQKGVHVGAGAIVHSYLGFGMTHIQDEIHKQAVDGEDAVCYMTGAPIGANVVGTGNASACRILIGKMMKSISESCQASETAAKPCLGDLARNRDAVDAIEGKFDFYAAAGFTYVVDFVNWWLKLHPAAAGVAAPFLKAYPKPSLDELSVAVEAMCAGDYSFVANRIGFKDLQHAFTGPDNAPYRCFQANYILILLGDMYGFPRHGHSITFLLDVEGEDLEWPLGALLDSRSKRTSGSAGGELRSEL